jgi:Initiator Rep protein, WH2/Initiator Replication protein, WH1
LLRVNGRTTAARKPAAVRKRAYEAERDVWLLLGNGRTASLAARLTRIRLAGLGALGMSLTIAQKTNLAGFPKPGELIEISGAHALEASDRSILNVLYQYAHDSGHLGELGAEWEISLAQLRSSKHESNDRLYDCLDRLMRVIVNVPYTSEEGEPRVLKTHLLDFVDLPKNEAVMRATVRFGVPKKLQPLIAQSSRWGRIKAEVVCAMTSKYAIALYELVQLRANMDRCVERFPIAQFRELLGVPPGTYGRGNNFQRFVIEPALLEVNGLSDMGVDVTLVRRSQFAPVEGVDVSWWRKEGEDFRAAMQERNRSGAWPVFEEVPRRW